MQAIIFICAILFVIIIFVQNHAIKKINDNIKIVHEIVDILNLRIKMLESYLANKGSSSNGTGRHSDKVEI